jgi:TolB-like protein
MASVIPGYKYDIFISYRQKDNKHDGWVTEFVDNLKGELEATFKEDISIYFDANPQDGLLETHIVDESLIKKLKCLIFIPVVSQTYCDLNSYAWNHEFCSFNKLAKEDRFGRDIKITGGNVASRILPVKIHDLDPEDRTLLENEIGGFIRSIEFIYKSAGVNRPLRANEDHPQDLNKIYYRDQINKIANAVKEIISALKKQNQEVEKVSKEEVNMKPAPLRKNKTKIIVGSLLLLALIVCGYLLIPKIFKSPEELEKSIAVLPFENLGDKEQEWFSEGITDVIINQLSKISDLRVLGRTSTLKYKESGKSITEIGHELGVNYLIEGTVQRQEDKMRISVQLIRVLKEGHIWADLYDREWKDIFVVQSEIAQQIADQLKTVLSPSEKENIEKSETKNLEAYNLYLQGRYFCNKRTEQGLKTSIDYFRKAIEEDPDYTLAYAGLADAYLYQTWHEWSPREEGYLRAKELAMKAIDLDKNLADAHATLGVLYLWSDWNWIEARKELLLSLKLNQNCITSHYYYSMLMDIMGQNAEARIHINKALELDPLFATMHWVSALYYYHEGRYKESSDECHNAQELNPEIGDYWIDQYNWLYFYNYVGQSENLKAVETLANILKRDSLFAGDINIMREKYTNSGIMGIYDWLINTQPGKPDPITLARWYAKLDKRNEAITWLEKAVEIRMVEIPRINNDLDFDKIRSEPGFQAIIKKMGLSEYQKQH